MFACQPDLTTLHSSTLNFSAYRQALKQQNAPCLPYLGVLLQDIVFCDEANANWVNAEAKIFNMEKLARLHQIAEPLRRFRTVRFDVRPIPELAAFLAKAYCPIAENALFAASLKCEARE